MFEKASYEGTLVPNRRRNMSLTNGLINLALAVGVWVVIWRMLK
jgi:hypothetical protein